MTTSQPSAAARVVGELRQLASDRLLPALPILERRGLVSQDLLKLELPVGMHRQGGNAPLADQAVIRALEDANIRVLVLKGTLLAHTVYDTQEQRLRSDTDLLVPPDQRDAAHAVLHKLTLVTSSETLQALTLETQSGWQGQIDGQPVLIDLHWQLFNHPAFAFLISFNQLWHHRQPLTINGHQTYGLGRVDAILHAVLHYFAHHEEGDRPAQWLLDGDLLWQQMNNAERHRVVRKAIRLGVAGILADYLGRANDRFHTGIPRSLLRRLKRDGQGEWRSQILTLDGRPLAAQLFTLRSVNGWRNRMDFLRRLIFPSPAYMACKYPDSSSWELPLLYVKRAFSGWKTRLH